MIYLSLFIVYAIGTYACSIRLLPSGWWRECAASGWHAGTDVERQKRGIFTAGNHLRMGVMTKGFLALAVPVLSVLHGLQRKNAGKISLFTAGWRFQLRTDGSPLGTGDSAAGA